LFPEAIIPFMFPAGPTSLITKFGYLAVAAIVGLESVGLPLPGEATLVTAAVYAGTTQQLNIWLVIASAVAGAVVGDNVGFWLGRELGFRLLIRYGSHVGLNEGRIKVGQYLFQLHGGKIVLFGRFFPVLRIWAAVLAGVNQMAWPKFVLFNAADSCSEGRPRNADCSYKNADRLMFDPRVAR
jgi:membrane protein DedA with SNARE-associated domain